MLQGFGFYVFTDIKMREETLLLLVFLLFLFVCFFLPFYPFLFFLCIQDDGTSFTMFAFLSELATTFLFCLFFLFSHGSSPRLSKHLTFALQAHWLCFLCQAIQLQK